MSHVKARMIGTTLEAVVLSDARPLFTLFFICERFFVFLRFFRLLQ